MISHFARNTYHRHIGSQDIVDYDCSSSDANAISYVNPAEDLGTLPDIYIITDDRGILRIGTQIANTTIPVYLAVFSNPGTRVYYHGTVVPKNEPFAKTTGVDDKA